LLRVFVDDTRTPPSDSWILANNFDEAIEFLRTRDVVELSLDHDLGYDSKSGYEICKWMVEHDVWPRYVRVHTANPVGRENMVQLLNHYKPEFVEVSIYFM
jgi:hypothetical protein